MSSPRRSNRSFFSSLFGRSLIITLLVYVLRGFRLLGFIPGGILLILILISLVTGIWYIVDQTKRF